MRRWAKMPSVQRLLIVGSGDIARRAASWLSKHFLVFALTRRAETAESWRGLNARLIRGDLDNPASLKRLAGWADLALHLAPPQGEGIHDQRTRNLLAALSRGESLPRRLVYVSTTGVYGDCGGATIDETRPRRPSSARALRRLDAEQTLRRWGASRQVSVILLRAPGIYAGDRLPVARLQAGLPALAEADDVYSNHIHADDLARACCLALFRGGAGRSFNVVDESELRMGAWFDLVADRLGYARPPRLPRVELEQRLSPAQYSFMLESRRIRNDRLGKELGLRLLYPTVSAGLEHPASA
ncbi:MAG: NAD-dependent epimerase/dehydratase family protein [Zoogloeaceae bacterium]|nr:NAD-dependent epimerase/dehydratase family protein [Zoogloeaceae bacterium]